MKKIRWITDWVCDRWLWIISWLIPMVIYFSTISAQLTGYGDSDELIYTGFLGGVAHPPGYPLLIIVLHFWLKFFTGNYAFGAHLLGLIIQTCTLGILWFVIKEIVYIKSKYLSLAATLMVWGVGFMQLFWLHANTLEVFGLNNLLSLIVILKVLKLKNTTKDWIILGLLWGLAISHHQIAFLLLPMISFKWWQDKNWKFAVCVFLGSFTTIVLYAGAMYFLALRGGTITTSWRLDPNIGSIYNHLIRKDFSGVLLETGNIQNAYLKTFDLNGSVDGLFTFIFKSIPNQFGWTFWILACVGTYHLIKNYRENWLLNLIIVPGILLAVYLPMRWQDNAEKLLIERIHLWIYVCISLASTCGLLFLITKYEKYNKIIFFVVITSLIWQGFKTYPLVNLRSWDGHYRSLWETLNSIENNGRLVCFSDVSCFGLVYLQNVEFVRPDVLILPITPQLKDRQLIKAGKLSGRYRDNPFRVAEFVAKGIRESGKVYFTEFNPLYTEWLGLGVTGKLSTSKGYGVSLGCATVKEDDSWIKLNSVKSRSLNLIKNQNIEIMDHKKDIINLNSPNLVNSNCGSENLLLTKARECAKSNSSCTLGNYLMLSELYPDKNKYRLEFADWLMSVNAPELAKREYKQVLNLNPDDWQVKELLDSIKYVPDLHEL